MLGSRLAVYGQVRTEHEAHLVLSAAAELSVGQVPVVLVAPDRFKPSLRPLCSETGGAAVSDFEAALSVVNTHLADRMVLCMPAGIRRLSAMGAVRALELLDEHPEAEGVCGIFQVSNQWSSYALCRSDISVPGGRTHFALPAESTDRQWGAAGLHGTLEVDALGPLALVRAGALERYMTEGRRPWLARGLELLYVRDGVRQGMLYTGFQAHLLPDYRSKCLLAPAESTDLAPQVFEWMAERDAEQIVMPGLGRVYRDDEAELSVAVGEAAVGAYGEPIARPIGPSGFYKSVSNGALVGPLQNWHGNQNALEVEKHGDLVRRVSDLKKKNNEYKARQKAYKKRHRRLRRLAYAAFAALFAILLALLVS